MFFERLFMLIGFSSMHRAQFRFPFLLAGICLTMANLIEICRFSFSRFQTCLDNFASCLYFSLHRDSNDFCILSHVCLSHGWCNFSLSSIYRQWGSSRVVVSCRVFRRLNYFFRSLACWSVFSFGMILLPLSKKRLHVVSATNTHGMSVENIVKFLTGRKMFIRES